VHHYVVRSNTITGSQSRFAAKYPSIGDDSGPSYLYVRTIVRVTKSFIDPCTPIHDVEIKALCSRIISSQPEIDQMKAKLRALDRCPPAALT
jgi:hypothetical protein